MNYFDVYSSYPDRTIVAAWDSQLAETRHVPWFKELLLRSASELFPRFAVCYADLRALPRGARRTFQRQIARSNERAATFPEWLQSSAGQALRLKLSRSLAGVALLMALGQGVATAATITVTTKDPRVRPDGQCSLIEAIINANADTATHADCAAGNGPDTIVLPEKTNVRLRKVYDTTYGPTGLPLITSAITIEGNGARIRRQVGPSAFRLVAVSNSGDLTLQNLNLSGGSFFDGGSVFNNGTLTIQNSTISGNKNGNGVSNHGSLTIQNSTISDNKNGAGVSNGGSVFIESRPILNIPLPAGTYCFYYYGYSYYGYVYPSGVSCFRFYPGSLTITDSTISNNLVGIINQFGTATIANSNISGNKGFFGGVFNNGGSHDYYGNYIPAGDVSIVNSTISKNSAQQGGGIFNRGTFTIENSTISGNKAADDGGGIFNASNYNAPAGDLSLLDSTITENRARDSGGGLFNQGSLNTSNSTITGNRARFGPDIFP